MQEFESLVRTLPAAGIEAILDVAYEHTADGDHLGPASYFSAAALVAIRNYLFQNSSPLFISGEKTFSRRGPRQPLLPLSPKRTKVRLKSLLYLVWLAPESTPNPRTSSGARVPSAA
jgi:hypothetical protein